MQLAILINLLLLAFSTQACKSELSYSTKGSSKSTETEIPLEPSIDILTLQQECPPTINEDQTYTCKITAGGNNSLAEIDFIRTQEDSCSWLLSQGTYPDYTITGTPSNTDVGTCNLSYFIKNDLDQNSKIKSLTITINNSIPKFQATEPISINMNSTTPLEFDLTATDESQGSAANYTLSPLSVGTECSDHAPAILHRGEPEGRGGAKPALFGPDQIYLTPCNKVT